MNGSIMIVFTLALGIALGTAMLSTVIFVYAKKQSFGLGGAVLTPFGVLLLGLSVWKTVDVSVSSDGGIQAKFEALEYKIGKDSEQTSERIGTLTRITSDKLVTKEHAAKVEIDNSLPDKVAAVCTTSSLLGKKLYFLTTNRHRMIEAVAQSEFPCSDPDAIEELVRINEKYATYLYGMVPKTKTTSAIVTASPDDL